MPLLPFARVAARQEQPYNSNTTSREISKDLTAAIKHASQMARVSPFHFYLSAIEVLYARCTAVKQMCLGVTDANRTSPDYANTVGFFLNFLPLKFAIDPKDSFVEVAKRTQKKIYEGLAHSSVPFEHVLDELKIPRSSAEPPLFQVAVNYRVASVMEVALGHAVMRADYGDDAKNPYDMTWSITESTEGKALLELTSRDYIYSETETSLAMDIFVHLLEHFSRHPSARVTEPKLYNTADTKKAIDIGSGRRTEFSWPGTLSDRFTEVAKRVPAAIAVKDDSCSMTYSELNGTVHAVAASLEAFPTGSRVAMLCLPSTTLIAALLGILHAGLVYVPLDLSLPATRHAAILGACQAQVLIHDTSTFEAAKSLTAGSNATLIDGSLLAPHELGVVSRARPNEPAFLLHTSGSTGKPKGIALTQAGCANFVAGLVDRLGLEAEIVLQQTSLGFDLSLAQIFVALGQGGTLIMVPQSIRGDVVSIASVMKQERVTLTGQTPSEYHVMLQHGEAILRDCNYWKYAILGGEMVPKQLRDAFRRLSSDQLRVFNIYGPTEITITTSIDEISRNEPETEDSELLRSIGYPCDNYSVYILDNDLQPVPIGYPGQICIGGAGVSLGYPSMPSLPRKSFSQTLLLPWKTGIRAGRVCTAQVTVESFVKMGGLSFWVVWAVILKSNFELREGVRIELEEIAHAACKIAPQRIAQAIVTVRGNSQFLAAHVVFEPEQALSDAELKQLIHDLPLPQYMRPSVIVPLSSLPVTVNGKVDRNAIAQLPLPDIQASTTQEPLTLAEGDLRLIWEDVLQLSRSSQRIGPDDDFFAHGGNSLLLVRLQSAIQESMGSTIPVRELYAASTLRDMSERIVTNSAAVPHQCIDWMDETRVKSDELYPSPTQRTERKTSGLQLLLTGATGFLSSYVLAALLDDPSISRVHAVAVDASKEATLLASHKLIIYHGSLLHPQLGLSDADIEVLQGTVDLVFHAGAIGHCMNNFASVRAANFPSTRFLAGMALRACVPFHFLSSPRVPLLKGEHQVRPESVSDKFPADDGSQGFMVSKWASERFLELLSNETGLEVCVHRACAAVGDRAPAEDAINALLLYSQKLRAAPVFENVVGFFDFEDVAKLGKSVATQVTSSEKSSGVRFVHHSSNVKVPIDEIARRLGDVYGGTFEARALDEWLASASKLGMEEMVASYLEAAIQKGETIVFPYLGA